MWHDPRFDPIPEDDYPQRAPALPVLLWDDDDEWRARANCRPTNDEPNTALFFDRKQQSNGLGVCSGCPVDMQCLEFGVRNRLQGVWGGLPEDEVQELIRAK